MDSERSNERLRDLLQDLDAERQAEEEWGREPPAVLSPRLHARLLEVTLGPQPSGLARMGSWLRELVSWRGLLVVGAAAAILVALYMRKSPVAPLVARYVIAASKSVTPRSPDGQAVLSRPIENFESLTEIELGAQDTLTLVLWPSEDEKGPVAVRSFIRRGGSIEPWRAAPEPWPDGSFRLHQPVERLDLKGEPSLLFYVCRTGTLPTLEQVRAGTSPDPRFCQSLSLRVLVKP